ncbi:MAG: 1-acyl-sn-glycerol-3-phosphate acyltransferase [Polyangiales bacterium]
MATITSYVAAWVLLTVLAPIWLLLGIVIGTVRRRSFVGLRLLAFAWFYFGTAIVALVRLAVAFALLRTKHDELQAHLFRLQQWWAAAVLRRASNLLSLDIQMEGAESALPGPTILLMRHASILDTLLPSVFIQAPAQWRVRYVLKQELLVDPCLDIVGNALPNYFVDRTGDRQNELDAIRALAQGLGDEGVLIYPEGTRFSQEKLLRARKRVEELCPELIGVAEELTDVLPPRPAGVLTLLDALPEVDCAIIAHHGLESFEKVKDVLSGSVVGAVVRCKVWRVRRSEIPMSDEARTRWLYEQWALVNAFVKDRKAR